MKRESIFILGRQPGIGRAELQSLFGPEHLEPVGEYAMACDKACDTVPFDRLGGSIRLAKPLAIFPTTVWSTVMRSTAESLPTVLDYFPPDGKLKLGISLFGLEADPKTLLHFGLKLKKICQAQGHHSVRVVPNNSLTLNSAQVLHNQLTGNLGLELLLIREKGQVQLAQTVAIQDIEAYAHRDQNRPKRDAFAGMLPPKLAQIIVNMAVGSLEPTLSNVILDPFCGTGVVLQEALLMGYGAYASDIEERKVEFTRVNLEWLATHGIKDTTPVLEAGDATNHTWQHPFAAIASETYLGHPLASWPKPEKLQEIIATCNVIIQKSLSNIANQTPKGLRLCLAVPAWIAPNGTTHHLPLLDQIEVLGYNRMSFSWVTAQEMVYHRPEQLVARELVVLTRK